MAWSRTNGAFIDRTSHGIILWAERIRTERRRLGLEDPNAPTTADVMIGDVLEKQPIPKARDDWLPEGAKLRVFHRRALERSRPRLGATSFEYGRFHVSHPEVHASYFRKRDRIASLVAEQWQREYREMQKKHPYSWHGTKPPATPKMEAPLLRSRSDPGLEASKESDPLIQRLLKLERTFSCEVR
eukprot:s380_g4.t1